MSPVLVAVFLVSLAGFGFFATRWIQLRSGYRAMSPAERRYADVSAESQRSRDKDSTRLATLRRRLRESGWPADVFTLVALAGFAFLVAAVGLRIAGAPEWVAALAAAPVAAGTVWLAFRIVVNRRNAQVNRQLVTMLELMVAQVRGGVGAERALMLVVPSLPEPLKSEMTTVLDRASSGGDLLDELRLLEQKYPSRAFGMFIAALEMDRSEGASLEPALNQAADMLKKSFALQSEARAELSSTRWEFIAVTLVICLISLKMVIDTDESGSPVYSTWWGMLILAAAVANTVFGIVRFNRLMDRLVKETT